MANQLRRKLVTKMLVLSQSTAHGLIMAIGHNAQRLVEVETKFVLEKLQHTLKTEDKNVTDLTPIFNSAMSFHAQKSVCGTTSLLGVNVTRIVAEEFNIEPEQFTKKLNSGVSHVKVMQMKNALVTKILVQ